jgi:hypothetical protein
VAPTAAAIAALNFNHLLDDYDTAVFLAHPLYQPLGVVIKNATGEDTLTDATALTFVYTVLLMVITGTTMWLVYGRGAGKKKMKPGQGPRTGEVVTAPRAPHKQLQKSLGEPCLDVRNSRASMPRSTRHSRAGCHCTAPALITSLGAPGTQGRGVAVWSIPEVSGWWTADHLPSMMEP